MKAILVDFASQNQPKWPSFKIFLGGVSRQGSFETASEEILGHEAGLQPASCPSRGQAAPAKPLSGSFETAFFCKKYRSQGVLKDILINIFRRRQPQRIY
jgi:hypothetical protein